jgi:hypothetical protein
VSPAWRIGPEVAWVDGDGEADRVAVLDLDRLDQPPFVLTDSSAVTWLCIDGTATDDELVTRVAAEYEVNPDAIREQVLAFLGDLAQRHLIVRT